MTDTTRKTTYDQLAGVTPNAPDSPLTNPRVIQRNGANGLTHMMSEIDNGVFAAWTNCWSCNKSVTACTCPTGPADPPHVRDWREKRFEGANRYSTKPLTDRTERELLAYSLAQYDLLLRTYGLVRMDSPEDAELHKRAVATFGEASNVIRDRLTTGGAPVTDEQDAVNDQVAWVVRFLLERGYRITAPGGNQLAAPPIPEGTVGPTGYVGQVEPKPESPVSSVSSVPLTGNRDFEPTTEAEEAIDAVKTAQSLDGGLDGALAAVAAAKNSPEVGSKWKHVAEPGLFEVVEGNPMDSLVYWREAGQEEAAVYCGPAHEFLMVFSQVNDD